jgi:hypothetical protein
MAIGCQESSSGGNEMFVEEYEKLNSTEQDLFAACVQFFLGHTYMVENEYDFVEEIKRSNKNYLFVERKYDMFQEYLGYAGFHLDIDRNYGVISLHSDFDGNREHFDPLTTKIILTLRLMFDEHRENLSLSPEVFVTVYEIHQKMMTLGAIQKKIPQNMLRDSLRKIASYMVIQKKSGNWYDPDTIILIQPSILFIVSNEQLTSIQKIADTEEETETNDEGTDTTSADPLV